MAHHHKTSDEIEREIEARRARIEERVDQISARLSPGQLLDEALRYTREGPGADFTRNLGRSVVQNPLPVTLMGASLAWLAVQSNLPRREREYGNGYDADATYGHYEVDEDDYPVASIKGRTLQRVGIVDSDEGRHSEFTDDAGRKFKALTNEAGHRAGHYIDESGRMFRGFIDDTGHRVSDFRDEAGNRIQQAGGWASHTWRKAGENAARLGEQAQHAGEKLRRQGGQAAHMADDFIHDQPLISGAIAFAIGALFGGALPHTRQEDEMFGDAADTVKDRAAQEAEHLYERGKEEAGHLHDQAREAAGHAYGEAKGAVREAADNARSEADKITHH